MLSGEKFFLTGCSGHVPVSVLPNRAQTNRKACSVLFFHGFKGFASWGFFVPLASHLAEQGFDVYRMNFSMNGLSMEDDSEISRPDEFRKNTFSAEVQEAEEVCSFVREHSGNNDLILLGHSRGGGIALLCAATPGLNATGVVALAPVSDFKAMLKPYNPEGWKSNGVAQVLNGRNGVLLPMDYALFEDALEEKNRVLGKIACLNCPIYLIHGDADESVNLSHSLAIANACQNVHLHILPGVGHTFGITHPYRDSDPLQQEYLHVLCRGVETALRTIRRIAQ